MMVAAARELLQPSFDFVVTSDRCGAHSNETDFLMGHPKVSYAGQRASVSKSRRRGTTTTWPGWAESHDDSKLCSDLPLRLSFVPCLPSKFSARIDPSVMLTRVHCPEYN